jgi:hypothetical protein
LITGDLSNSRFNSPDYYRTAEYVQKNEFSVNHSRTYHYRQFSNGKSNFRYFTFSLKKFQANYNRQIENILKTQTILCLKIDKLRQIYPKWNELKYSFSEHSDLYKRENPVNRFCPTNNLLHVLTSNMSNNLSFRKCINQIRITPFYNISNHFFTG